MSTLLASCGESAQERAAREEQARQEQLAIEQAAAEQARVEAEQARIREQQQEQERIAREVQERIDRIYGDYALSTGATPYSGCYGANIAYDPSNCSHIEVNTPKNSDVLVMLKQDDEVVAHAYIRAGASYTFSLPHGSYQPFFYYGTGWYPEKEMSSAPCAGLKGGFLNGETIGKDDPQSIRHQTLTYTLILQQNGNFQTQPSNLEEML